MQSDHRFRATLVALALFVAPLAVGADAPAPLKPGEGYVALVYDVLQPIGDVKFNFNGQSKKYAVGGKYGAGRNLVVQALPAGRYCLEEFRVQGNKWTQNDRSGICFAVVAGEVSYGGDFMPRRFSTPRGYFDVVLRVSDPATTVARLEKEYPALWAQHRGAPERYLPDEDANRRLFADIGDQLGDYGAYKAARDYLKLAAKMGSGYAMQLLGIHHQNGWGMTVDLAEAARWYKAGMEVDDWRSAALLCIANDLGQGVPEDPVLALEYCSRAAEREDAMAMWYLGRMLTLGRGGPADPTRGEELTRKAEAVENLPAKLYWGYELKRPDGTYSDPEGSYRITKLAFERGLERARFRLAYYTRKGIGTTADASKAADLYIGGGKKGNANGYYQAALIYARGDGVARDLKRVRQLFDLYLHDGGDDALNGVAWVLATHDLAEIRDGKRAVELARKANKNHPDTPAWLDTLAAAYAEVGDWEQAVAQQGRAIAILNERGASTTTIDDYKSRLEKYRQHQPHRDKWE